MSDIPTPPVVKVAFDNADNKFNAMFLATLFHAISSLAPQSVPASARKVVETAAMFEAYLQT